MKNPTMTSSLQEKHFIDLTQDQEVISLKPSGKPTYSETDRLMLIEAHEMANFAYDMVNLIFEFNSPQAVK